MTDVAIRSGPTIVSYSELDTARQCQFKHLIAYKQRWVAPTTGPALAKGTLWHSVMEAHYKTLRRIQKKQKEGVSFTTKAITAELHKAVAPWLWDERSAKQTDDQELIEWMYRGYVEHYGIDDDWEILAIEHAPVVPLPTATGRASRYHLKLKIDLIIRERSTGNIYIVDHKSCKDLPTDKMLDLNDQFGLYVWAMRKLGRDIFGAIHSAARTQRNKDQTKNPQALVDRFRRKPLFRTEIEMRTLAHEAYLWARKIWATKPEETPRSPNEDTCRWRCDYTEACLLSRKGSDLRGTLLDFGFRQDFTRH